MKTPKEIQRQIQGLEAMKTWLPQNSLFGEDNWKVIDEQVQILKGESTFEEIESFYIDEEGEEAAPCGLFDAEEWLEGQRNEDLFEQK